MYEGFAEIYDELMGDVRYDEWADFYTALMAAYGIRGGRICECACGTGNLTIPLRKRGFQITGIDLSQEMLWSAAQKARRMGLAIPFIRQDMRELRLHHPMDAILATCDGVNYLPEEKDLHAFFRSAYEALRPGGGLFFDISTPHKLKHDLGNQILCDDGEHITYLWQNRYSERKRTVEMHLCFFVKQADGSYRRIDEEQTQKAHEMEELKTALAGAGFERIAFFGNRRMEPAKEGEQRWHVAALRRAEPDLTSEGLK